MKLIDKFESSDNQDVKTFEEIFKIALNVPSSEKVEILDITYDSNRIVKVGEILINLDLTVKSKVNSLLNDSKICVICKEQKELNEFSPKKGYILGVNSRCKKCCVKIVRDIQKRNSKCYK